MAEAVETGSSWDACFASSFCQDCLIYSRFPGGLNGNGEKSEVVTRGRLLLEPVEDLQSQVLWFLDQLGLAQLF